MSTTLEREIVLSPGGAVPSEARTGVDDRHAAGRCETPEPRRTRASTVADPRTNTIVVLVAPELLGSLPDFDAVWTTLRSSPGAARALVRVRCAADLKLAAAMAKSELPVEVLLAADLDHGDLPRDLAGKSVRMPPGSTPTELDEFVWALSDVVLVDPRAAASPGLLDLMNKQEKQIIRPGDVLPSLPVRHPDFAGGLDTNRRRWRWFASHLCGRVERFCMELFALNRRAEAGDGYQHGRGRIARSFSLRWRSLQRPYFAPDEPCDETRDWRKLVPDTMAKADDALIVVRFNALDHSALYGSMLHRDLIWIAWFASAFAVFAAVFGSLGSFGEGLTWPCIELVTLIIIFLIILTIRHVDLQGHWMACRLAAEQLRIARLCLPLFVVPWALKGSDQPQSDASMFTIRALDEVKRAVRDQGLPRPPPELTAARAAAWLCLIAGDQESYHHNNELWLERAETTLGNSAIAVFSLAVAAVLLHLGHYFLAETTGPWRPVMARLTDWIPWLLIPTAAGPAVAAALHGVSTHLGIVHRIALSREMHGELASIVGRLRLIEASAAREGDWPELRALALRASNAMGIENTSWHRLVRRVRDDIT